MPNILFTHLSSTDKFTRRLAHTATSTQRQAHRPGTQANRASAVRLFVAFCHRIKVRYQTINSSHVCWYIEYLARHVSSPATISNHLSHLRTYYRMAGLDLSPLLAPRVATAIRGIQMCKRHTPTSKPPATPQLVREVLRCKDVLDYPEQLSAAIVFMFMGFIRQSNLASKSRGRNSLRKTLAHAAS